MFTFYQNKIFRLVYERTEFNLIKRGKFSILSLNENRINVLFQGKSPILNK